MSVAEGAEIHVGQRVTVDDEERVGADDGLGEARPAGTAQDSWIFPGVAHVRRQIGPVAEYRRYRFRTVVQVEHELGHATRREPADDAADERLAGERDRRLGPDQRQRTKPCAQSGGQHQRMSYQGAIN